MYNYEWDKKTRGYRLTTQTGKYVASELRPVFAEELKIIGFDEHFSFDYKEKRPLMWAKNNVYMYNGEEVAKLHKTQQGKPLEKEFLGAVYKLTPVDVEKMIHQNQKIMKSLVSNTLKRIKEIFDAFVERTDLTYIAFSGGKDSVLLLDLCHQVLPMSVPVIFSDTSMELPATYDIWNDVQAKYPGRRFLKISAENNALENWNRFGPPSRTLDWCCSVHKSTPVILALKNQLHLSAIKTLAFLGIRSDESLKRDSYESDVGIGVKNASQVNAMPIESWGTQELFLYLFERQLPIHPAYRYGLPRVGCVMCPKASDKYAWFVDNIFPDALAPYHDCIINSSLKNFETTTDAKEYIASSGWQARRNGLEIKNRIYVPSEKIKGNEAYWLNVNAPLAFFLEWCKTIASIESYEGKMLLLACKSSSLQQCSYDITLDIANDTVLNVHAKINTENIVQRKILQAQLKKVICKSIACIGCKACEADCSYGALKFTDGNISVDSTKCIHCLKCHNIDYGCWRYKSMMVPNSSDTPLKSIANYQNFGLREIWVELYSSMRENFPDTVADGTLGAPMVDSARIWFKQALLTRDSRTLEPGRLLDVAAQMGIDNDMLWCLIWIALVNNAPLLKWFAATLQFDKQYSIDDISNKLGDIVSASTKKGGLQALYNMFKSCPIGMGSDPIVQVTQKGVRVLGLKRVSKSVSPLVILYSLYLMADIADRTSFTLSEMMSGDFDSPFISPLVAFGMSIEELKGQCMGISSIYPQFISCSFALGLDEVKIFPKEKSLDDVISLILGE